MMNNITLNFSKNPELKEAFSHKEIGHTCRFEIEMQVNEMDADEVRGIIKEIELEGYEGPVAADGKPKGPTKPNADEPVMVVITASRSKKSKADTESPVYDY